MGYSGVSGMLAAFITSPFSGALLGLESAQGGSGGKAAYFWVLFPSLVSSAVATVVFVLLSGNFFETLYAFPLYAPRLVDLLYAAPLGLIGGAVGLLFMWSLRHLQRLFKPMKGHVVLRGLVGGLGMGIIGALLPLTLFSGEEQTAELIPGAAEIGLRCWLCWRWPSCSPRRSCSLPAGKAATSSRSCSPASPWAWR